MRRYPLRATGRRVGVRAAGLLGLIIGSVVAVAAPSANASPASAEAGAGDAMSAVAAMQPSWNLGNTLDAIPTETSWGNPLTTKALFDTLRHNGYRSVRIPVTWYPHQGAAPSYTIDPTWLARVKQVVDWALADGLWVDLNVHHDSWDWIASMPTDHDNVLARFNATWTQIATEFRDEPRGLLFESVNEPSFTNATDAQGTQLLGELNTSFDHVVRQTGGANTHRLLVLPTLGSSPTQQGMDDLYNTIQSLHDTDLVATVHYYGFWPFSADIAGVTTFNSAVLQDMTTDFGLMHSELIAKGIPVYLGEFGLLSYPDYTRLADNVERGEALKYFEAFDNQARMSGVTTALWDAGSFLNRTTLQWRDPDLFALLRSGWTQRSATASSDQVFVPGTGQIADQTLTLNLNGTTLVGLAQRGGDPLVPGRDYVLSGDQLTLKASALTRLVGNRTEGVNATLEAYFTGGVPWRVNVITADQPVASNATGTTDSYAVPTAFHGDVLESMEAHYADGSDAGPANWTSYQEFGSSFEPDYATNAILLTSGFFGSLTDGARVTLTFHFWSGAVVTYYVTKTGTSVVGSTS